MQYLLNCVPTALGGPLKELSVDGKASAVTVEAIRRFQTMTLGIVSGRIDTYGEALKHLQQHDPFPHLLLPMENIGIKYTMFLPDGTPVKASASVKVKQSSIKTFPMKGA